MRVKAINGDAVARAVATILNTDLDDTHTHTKGWRALAEATQAYFKAHTEAFDLVNDEDADHDT